MSAVPKKKLCWNCEGSVSKQIDNCPYCGVYIHADELEENSSWIPSYRPSNKTEEIPSPIYQIHGEQEEESSDDANEDEVENFSTQPKDTPFIELYSHLKKDLFPLLFLMMGSIFFLFGIVLLLFSQNGALTLQWQGNQAFYFLISSIPLTGLGWCFLQRLEQKE